MWCCNPLEPLSPEEQEKAPENEIVQTGAKSKAVRSGVLSESKVKDNDQIVSVTVPPGASPGELLTVKSLDGRRVAKAKVPEGFVPGQCFTVRFPSASEVAESREHDGGLLETLDYLLTPTPDTDKKSAEAKPDAKPTKLSKPTGSKTESKSAHKSILKSTEKGSTSPRNVVEASPIRRVQGEPVAASVETVDSVEAQEAREGVIKSPSFVETLESLLIPEPDPTPVPAKSSKARAKPTAPAPAPPAPMPSSSNHTILVNVPPGMPPGSMIQVEVPGENRTLSAQVPPGVTAFHVAYTPQKQQQQYTPQYMPQYMQQSTPPPVIATSKEAMPNRPSPGGHKLLLVRVPPGTPPGTTLHVSVPDEPGRILAARVPQGNVREFHVSYESRPTVVDAHTMLPPANPYQQGLTGW